MKVRANHAVAVFHRGPLVAAGGRVLRNLAKDPGVGRRGAADHHAVAASFGHHRRRSLRSADVAVADHRNLHRLLHAGDPLPARLPAIALFARAGMQRHGVQPLGFGHARQLQANNVGVVPAQAELHRERNLHRLAHGLENLFDPRQIAQQARAAVGADDLLGGAAEIEIDQVEAAFLNDASGLSQRFWVGAEELRADGMFVLVEGEVAAALGLAHAAETVGGGEHGNQQAAAGLGVGDGVVDGFRAVCFRALRP